MRQMTKQEVFAYRRREFCGDEFYNGQLRVYEEACRWMNEFQKKRRPPNEGELVEFEIAKFDMKAQRRFLFGD